VSWKHNSPAKQRRLANAWTVVCLKLPIMTINFE